MTSRAWRLATRARADAHAVHVATAFAGEKAPLTPQPWGEAGAPRSRGAGGAILRAVGASAIAVSLLLSSLAAARGSSVTPPRSWIDLCGMQASFAGVPIPPGAVVVVSDPQGTRCGEFWVEFAGIYGVMPCYGDDPTTDSDEGPLPGERLSFTINGTAATPQPVARNGTAVPAGTLVTWTQSGDLWQVDLVVPPRPTVSVTLAAAAVDLRWQPAGPDVAGYEIWRSLAPYFAPGDPGAERVGTLAAGSGASGWSAPGGVGDPAANYTYRVRSMNALSETVGISQAVAEFEFLLNH